MSARQLTKLAPLAVGFLLFGRSSADERPLPTGEDANLLRVCLKVNRRPIMTAGCSKLTSDANDEAWCREWVLTDLDSRCFAAFFELGAWDPHAGPEQHRTYRAPAEKRLQVASIRCDSAERSVVAHTRCAVDALLRTSDIARRYGKAMFLAECVGSELESSRYYCAYNSAGPDGHERTTEDCLVAWMDDLPKRVFTVPTVDENHPFSDKLAELKVTYRERKSEVHECAETAGARYARLFPSAP